MFLQGNSRKRFETRLFLINRNSWPYTSVSFKDNLIRDIYFLNRIAGVEKNLEEWTINTILNYSNNGFIKDSESFLLRFREIKDQLEMEYKEAEYIEKGKNGNRIRDHYGSLPLMNGVV